MCSVGWLWTDTVRLSKLLNSKEIWWARFDIIVEGIKERVELCKYSWSDFQTRECNQVTHLLVQYILCFFFVWDLIGLWIVLRVRPCFQTRHRHEMLCWVSTVGTTSISSKLVFSWLLGQTYSMFLRYNSRN